jgi:ABC-2 type transport system permease protein
VYWGDWQVPVLVEICIVAAVGLVMLAIAAAEFRRTD